MYNNKAFFAFANVFLILIIILLQPPIVKCLTRVWHPNISEEGSICLSLLRQNSLDGFGKFFGICFILIFRS